MQVKIAKFTPDYSDLVCDIMSKLDAYFSPETIDFAQKKLPELQGFLAYLANDKVVGFIVFGYLSDTSVKIYRMGILPDYQHQGIGSHLLKYTEKHLQKQKKLSIELITLDEHPDYPGYALTRQFYFTHHFKEVEKSEVADGVILLKMKKNLIFLPTKI